jgi:hypothetical protein
MNGSESVLWSRHRTPWTFLPSLTMLQARENTLLTSVHAGEAQNRDSLEYETEQ